MLTQLDLVHCALTDVLAHPLGLVLVCGKCWISSVPQDEPKAVVEAKLKEFEEAEAKAAEAKAKAKAKAKKPGVPKAATPSAQHSGSAAPPVWDDVGYTIKVLLFANRMQLLR